MGIKVGVDLDGVVANFVGGVREWSLANVGKDTGKVAKSWDWMKDTLTKDELNKFWVEVSDPESKFWTGLKQLSDGVNLVGEFVQRGCEITYITSRPGDHARAWAIQWLRGWFEDVPQVIVVPVGKNAAKAKADILDILKIDWFVDDNVPNVLEAAKIPTVERVWLAAREYNAEFVDEKSRVERIDLTELTWRLEASRVSGN